MHFGIHHAAHPIADFMRLWDHRVTFALQRDGRLPVEGSVRIGAASGQLDFARRLISTAQFCWGKSEADNHSKIKQMESAATALALLLSAHGVMRRRGAIRIKQIAICTDCLFAAVR
jgi:hypothetical protein